MNMEQKSLTRLFVSLLIISVFVAILLATIINLSIGTDRPDQTM